MFLSGPGSACFESEEKAIVESESVIFQVAKMVYFFFFFDAIASLSLSSDFLIEFRKPF